MFRDVMVVTSRRVRERRVELQGTTFRLKTRPPDAIFGVRPVWRGRTRVPVSDPSRTLVDLLDEPAMGGGIRHVAEVAAAYFGGEHRDDRLLLDYADRLRNRSIPKRLGYIVEALGVDAPGINATCRARMSAGVVALDPTIRHKGRILRRWNLRVNANLRGGAV
ncbi:MAG: hypothetical protein L0323_03205 [Planctomycetes bacterium]|nr:hypothetical protein [Planctomycetota bacterium]